MATDTLIGVDADEVTHLLEPGSEREAACGRPVARTAELADVREQRVTCADCHELGSAAAALVARLRDEP